MKNLALIGERHVHRSHRVQTGVKIVVFWQFFTIQSNVIIQIRVKFDLVESLFYSGVALFTWVGEGCMCMDLLAVLQCQANDA